MVEASTSQGNIQLQPNHADRVQSIRPKVHLPRFSDVFQQSNQDIVKGRLSTAPLIRGPAIPSAMNTRTGANQPITQGGAVGAYLNEYGAICFIQSIPINSLK